MKLIGSWGLAIFVLTTLFWSIIFSISSRADMESDCK